MSSIPEDAPVLRDFLLEVLRRQDFNDIMS